VEDGSDKHTPGMQLGLAKSKISIENIMSYQQKAAQNPSVS
jgi:hypothetical protein